MGSYKWSYKFPHMDHTYSYPTYTPLIATDDPPSRPKPYTFKTYRIPIGPFKGTLTGTLRALQERMVPKPASPLNLKGPKLNPKQGLSLRLRAWDLEFSVSGLAFRALGFRVEGKVQGRSLGLRV